MFTHLRVADTHSFAHVQETRKKIYIYIGVYASTHLYIYPQVCPCARGYLLENENDKENETYVGPNTTVPKRTNMRDTHPHLECSNGI